MKLLLHCTLLILLYCSSSALLAQDKIRVFGTVTDETGQGAVSVTVIGNDREDGTYTDADGNYELMLSEKDSIKIEFRFPQYKPQVEYIVEPKEDEYEVNVQLEPFETDVIIVTTDKFPVRAEEVTSSMEVVETETIERFAPIEITDAMSQVSGITIYDDQPSIRGSSGYTYGAGSRVLTLLNGLPMLRADRSSATFSMLPVDNIQQVEIFKGASSVLYGAGAMGGVINVITADPADTPRTVIRAGCTVFDTPPNDSADWDGRSSAIVPNIHFFHSRKVGNLDVSLLADFIKRTGYRYEEFEDRVRVMGMFKYHVPTNAEWIDDLSIGLNVQASIDSSATMIAWQDYPANALRPGEGFLSYQLLYNYSIDPSIELETENSVLSLKGRWFRNVNEISTGQSGSADLYYGDLSYLHNFSEHISVVAGANATFNDVEADSTFGNSWGLQLAGFLQMKFKIGDRLNLLAGGRWQYEEVQGDTVQSIENKGTAPLFEKQTMNEPIFRAGLNYRPAVGTFIRASFGQAIRSPSVAERFTSTAAGPIIVIPSPEIGIERGWTAEVGAKQLYSFGNKIRGFVDVSAFWLEFENMVEFYVDTDLLINQGEIGFRAQNLSNARVQGLEGNINFQYETNENWNIYFTGGITFTDPIDLDGDESLDGDDSLPKFQAAALQSVLGGFEGEFPQDLPRTLKYRNRTIGRASLELAYKKWSFTTNYRYTSEMVNVDMIFLIPGFFPGTADFRANNPGGWQEVDFILAYRVPSYTISFHVFNATNTEFMTIPGTLGQQRSFAVQAKVNI
mgnify:CR=1 FL=1